VITREQAGALADMTRVFRPAWDTRAIVSAIEEVRHQDARAIAWALITVALNPQMRTPKTLTFEGDHWRAPTPASRPQPHVREDTTELTDTGRAHIEAARQTARAAQTRRQQ
jgi:hypothetical protein